jgi:prepilin-type N-terminal cleavage/methylation domain-containing protein
MKIRQCRKSGFTLVEIMIVVAIIGLLATMAMPSFRKARETAAKNTCISNLQNIDGAIQQWATDLRKDEGAPVTYQDIGSYLKNDVSCPSGGTTFEDSYTITTVDAAPTCQRRPETHKLPNRR